MKPRRLVSAFTFSINCEGSIAMVGRSVETHGAGVNGKAFYCRVTESLREALSSPVESTRLTS